MKILEDTVYLLDLRPKALPKELGLSTIKVFILMIGGSKVG